jgi:acetoin utilization deacetylase AcuC-like enzyme
MNKTGIIFFPAFDWAISPTHPEREERLLYTRDQLFEEGIMDMPQIIEYKPRLAELKDIARVHFCVPDIPEQITEAHLISAGSSLVIADAVINKEIKNGFSIARPPGHHAKTVVHGNRGFCNINNEAIMVEYIRHKYGIRKIAVVDTDVHHGDGSQEIFYHDPDILFISFHQDGRTLYPGTGFLDELGGLNAWGCNINIPLPPETTDEGIHYVLDNLVLPILKEFQPELVVNSAGQDNHYTDPLASMCFSAQGYALLNEKLAPDIAVLEGGYSVETALPYINMGIIMAMAKIDYSNLREPDYNPHKFKESSVNMEVIKKMVTQQKNQFFRREEQQQKYRIMYDNQLYSYEESIFYDTDYISERQQNQVKVCSECPGYRLIDSLAHYRDGRRARVFCISIPIFSCPLCQEQAYKAYEEIPKQKDIAYDYIYLQDRKNNVFKAYNLILKQEKVY